MKKRPEYNLKATGNRLRRLRKQKKLSVEDVRRYMGLASVQAIYRWEQGCNYPTADNLLALAELYGVNPMKILVKKSARQVNWCEEKIDLLCVPGAEFFVCY